MALNSIDQAILAHHTWVVRFQTAIQGVNRESFNLASARDDTACALGRWLDTPASLALLGPDASQEIKVLHKTFHEIAGDLAEKINRQDALDELELLLGEFENLSGQLVQLLRLAKRRMP
ncbi:MAG: CZB domain-containing protein [Azonexus sp.]|nr:CZB domain-containing protein [Azonexus sp.]MCK6411186.1 CZB domain-containing protein [Azonexus sp.]